MNRYPRVSVLIPTYNYARYLPETLTSVIEQDERDIEIIVADDASTDETDEVMRRFCVIDPRIRYVRHAENLGMVENWNWCLNEARGTYVKYLLADDKLSRPYSLRKLADALEQDPRAALAASARSIIDEESRELSVVQPLGKRDRIFSNEWMLRRYVDRDAKHINPIGEPSAVMFRRMHAARGFDVTYRQLVDIEMWFHLLENGRMHYIAEPLCCFRRHAEQQTGVNRESFLHQQEEIALCKTYARATVVKRVLFHKMYRIAKLDAPALRETLDALRREYTTPEYYAHLLRYKIVRPFENAVRSIRKRTHPDETGPE